MIKTALVCVFIAVIGLFIYLYFYLGAYKDVTITVEQRGPLYLAYEEHVGPYHEIGPPIHDVEVWAAAQNLACPLTFGEFLDDPESIDQDRLRSHVGCLLSTPAAPGSGDIHFEERPKKSYVLARFTGSPAIGPFKVYPKIKQYVNEHRLKITTSAIEIYRVEGQKVTTEYLFAISEPGAAQ
jgi:AraC family transcriptional regulator